MRLLITGCAVALLSGCGTVKTLSDAPGAADDLARWQSNCNTIPRAYSGAAYQFCNLDSPQRSGSHWSAPTIGLDLIVSGIADTVVLPYTGYQQYQKGDIKVRRKQY